MTLIPVGRLQVATPETMAVAVNNPTVARDAVDARIQDVAADIISSTPAVVEAAADAVAAELASENIPRAFPEGPVSYTSNRKVPVRWVHRTLSDPVGDMVGDRIAGTWSGTAERRGDVAVLSPDGKLDPAQIPSTFATREWVASRTTGGGGGGVRAVTERVVRGEFPIFGARVAAARAAESALVVVCAGSSTTAASPGYVGRLVQILQGVYPTAAPTVAQWSVSATFTANTNAGVHGYSVGEGGAIAADYLTDDESDRVAALAPGLIVHMVGANDYWRSVVPATYKTQVLARIDYLNSKMPLPCQHVLVHAYPRAGNPGETRYLYPWGEYRQALAEIAAARADTVLIDLSGEYAAVGVAEDSRPDPLVLISEDDTHQTPAGYRFMADLLAGYLTT